MRNVIIKKSKIHGKGVFAARNFKKEEIVLQWKPKRILTKKQALRLSLKEKIYISRISKNRYALMGLPERYVNHSCEANTYSKNGFDKAKRAIKKGEEITADYTKEDILFGFKCRCKNKTCKGKITRR